MDPEPDTKLPELIGSIYEAGMDSARWPSVMQMAMSHFGSTLGMLWTHDFTHNRMYAPNTELSCMVASDARCASDFKEYYYSRNVWVPRSKFLPEGHTIVSSALYPESQLERTEFYADWLRPNDLYHAIGSAVIKEADRDVKLSFVRPRRAGQFSCAEQRRMASILPHVRNAFLLHRNLGRMRALADAATAALERLSIGVILVSRDAALVYANAAARAMAQETGAFELASPVRCLSSTQTLALARLVAEASQTTTGTGVGSGGTLKLVGTGGDVQVVVTPLSASYKELSDHASGALFCTVPGRLPADVAEILRRVHRLSPAEAALAVALIEGLSPKEIAAQRSTTLNTVRSQLKSICQKTGTRRQADLVRVLLGSIPVVRLA